MRVLSGLVWFQVQIYIKIVFEKIWTMGLNNDNHLNSTVT